MREKLLYGVWAALYILCVGLGTIQDPTGFGKAVLVGIAVLFFIPGGILLYDGVRTENKKAVLQVRLVAAVSLGLTLILLIVNFLSFTVSEAAGGVLYDLLALVSAPMLCGQYWLLSLFLWACLLIASFTLNKQSFSGQKDR